MEANRDLNIGWRDANGDLINKIEGAGNLEQIACISNKSKKMKLDEKENWGSLMGFIKRKKENNLLEIISNGRTFKIGDKANIYYDKNLGYFVIENSLGSKTRLEEASEESELFFIINDALVKKIDDLDYPSECGEPTVFEKELRDTHKRIYEKIIPKENAIGFYYLDNIGNFVVSILVE